MLEIMKYQNIYLLYGASDNLLSKAGVFSKTLGKSGLNNAKNLATMPGCALDNIGDIFEEKGPKYAVAHAGGNESVLNKIGREADALPKNDVQKKFNDIMGETNEDLGTKQTKINPVEEATKWQGSGKYPGVDEFKDITLKAGEVYYRGEPNGSEFFTTKAAIEESGRNAKNLFEGLQVEENPIHGYRGTMRGYKLSDNIDAAEGFAKANPQFGLGGLPQQFIPNVNELIEKGILVPVDDIPLIK